MNRSWPTLVVLGALLAMPLVEASAQEGGVPVVDQPGTASLSDPLNGTTSIGPWGGYVFFRKDFDNGIGYRNGFSSLGWFQPFQFSDDTAFFAQGNLFVTDDGQVGGNLGGGYRSYTPASNSLWEAYGFLDFDESVNDNRYSQASVGFASRSERIDFITNAYLPFDSERNFLAVQSLNGPLVLSGNNLFVTGQALFEEAMPGADFEVGFPVLDPSALGRVRGYVGAYAYNAEDKDPIGVRARVESHFNQFASINASFMHDDVNGGMATVAVELRSWNRRLPELAHSNANNRARLYLPVTRQNRVAVDIFSAGDFVTEALGADGTPIDFVWVNNGNAAPGSGTFEDPFHDMPASAPGADYILVYEGPSSTANPVLGGIVLQNGQRLYGEGFEFFIDITGTKFGPDPAVVSITDIEPAWNTVGNHPFVSNTAGSFATLASNNEVGGFNIINTLGPAITGTGINNFNLFDLNVGVPGFGNASAGIFLQNASGFGTIDNFTMWGNAGGGIIINNTNTAPLALAVNGNTTVDPNVVGGGQALALIANNSTIIANPATLAGTGINDFRSTGASAGLALVADNGGLIDAAVDSSAFDNTTVGDGVMVLLDNASTIALDMNNTTADNASAFGMVVALANNSQFIGNVTGTSPGDSSFSGADFDGVALFADGSPSAANQLHFLNTFINGSMGDGIHIELTNNTFFDVRFQNGQIVGSGGDAIDDFQDGSSTLDLLVNPSLLTMSGENGFLFELHNGSVLNATFLNSDLSDSGLAGTLGAGNGIHGIMDSAAIANLFLENTAVDRSGEHGFFLQASGAAQFNGLFDNSSFNNSNQNAGPFDGLHVEVDGVGTVAVLDLVDTQVDNTLGGGGMQQNALDFFVNNSGMFTFSAMDSGLFGQNPSSFNNATGDGVLGRVNNGGIADVTFDGSSIDNSGDDGFDLLATDTLAVGGSSLIARVINGSSVNNSDFNGFLASASDAGTFLGILVDASTVNDSGFPGLFGDGMNLNVDTGATLTAMVQNGSSVDNSGLGGIVFTANAATANLLVDGSTVDGSNGGDGINLNASNAADLNADIVNGSSVSNNDESGIELAATNPGTTADLNVLDSMVNGNMGGSGADITVDDEAAFTGNISGSSFNGNDQDGLALSASNTNTTADLTIANSTFDNNVNGNGLNLMVDDMAALTTNVTGPSSASGNAQDGVNLLVDGASTTTTANFDQLSADNNMDDGFDVLVTNAAQLDMTVTGASTGSFNMDNGFILTANDMTASIVHLNMMDGNVFNDNMTGYGILVDANGIQELEAIVSGGASRNALDGARLQASMVNTITTIGATGPGAYSANGGHGVIIDLDNTVNPINQVLVSNLSADGNTLTGVSVLADNETITEVLIDAALVSNSMGGDGILVDLNSSLVDTLTVSNGGSATNLLNGLNIDLDATTVNNLNIVDNNTGGVGGIVGLEFIISGSTNPLMGNPQGVFAITNTSAAADVTGFIFDISGSNAGVDPVFDTLNSMFGFKFLPFGGTDTTTGLATINGVVVVPPIVDVAMTDDTMDSMGTILVGGGIPNNTAIMDLTFADFNIGETFQWDIDVDPAPNVDQGIDGDQLAGSFIHVDFTGGLFIEGNLVQTGPNTSEFMATSGNISSPGFSENGADGILINAQSGSVIGTMTINNNLVDMNGLHGIEVVASDSTLPGPGNALVSNNIITNHAGGDGFHMVNPDTNGTPIGMDFVDNTITDNTGGAGINISVNTDSGSLTSMSSGNIIDRNGTSGVNLNAEGTADLTASFAGGSMSDNTGIGFRLVAQDDSTFDVTAGGPNMGDGVGINNNLDAGVGVSLFDNAMGRLGVQGNTISGTTNGPLLNFDGQGVHVRMNDNSQLLNGSLVSNNTITGNAAAGIDFFVDGATTVGTLDIDANTITGNTADGILFTRVADGHVSGPVTISNNLITGGTDGIELIARNGASTDNYNLLDNMILGVGGRGVVLEQGFDARQNVDMDGNTIDGSGSHGIQGFQTAGTLITELRLLTGTWQNNTVINNGGDGMQLSSVLSGLFVTNNDISFNEQQGIDVTGPGTMSATFNLVEMNEGGGIYVTGVGNKNMSFNNNMILLNTGDGFRLVNNGNAMTPMGDFSFTIGASNNLIEGNTERGINILNQGTADTTLTMNNNLINLNSREGVYIMNTASTNQSAAFGAAVLADGSFDAIPRLNLTMNANTITGNGNAGTSLPGQDSTGGFVLRVGTSDAPNDDTDPGQFASDGRGGVVAFVTNNNFVGNAGNDVFIHSFVSATLGPTGTTWTDVAYNAGAYRGDPLARLDLAFTGNTGDEALVTNLGAFYNNAEAVFKSRTTGQTDPGPFTSATRRRNAQRLAFRGINVSGDYTNPTTPGGASDGFLYPGVGDSTFRRTAGSNTGGFTTADLFTDAEPFAGAIFGERPFVWGIWP